MSRQRFTILYEPGTARKVQRERVWICDHRGRERADAFEDELAHFFDLLQDCPEMGSPSPWGEHERHWFLRRSRFHVVIRTAHEATVFHVLFAADVAGDHVRVVTAYIPDPLKWEPGCWQRRQRT